MYTDMYKNIPADPTQSDADWTGIVCVSEVEDKKITRESNVDPVKTAC